MHEINLSAKQIVRREDMDGAPDGLVTDLITRKMADALYEQAIKELGPQIRMAINKSVMQSYDLESNEYTILSGITIGTKPKDFSSETKSDIEVIKN